MEYLKNENVKFDTGFEIDVDEVVEAIRQTNLALSALPFSLYKKIDYKTTSSIVGSMFCNELADITSALVNPIEKGHPDILPKTAIDATEEQLRNYPVGLEVKTTIGNIPKGGNLRAGQPRVDVLTDITWQAHHRDVKKLFGLVWDFVPQAETNHQNPLPQSTGAFYSQHLVEDNWGKISGTTGRNTKVSGMLSSGKQKMGAGWVAILNDKKYLDTYGSILDVPSENS